MDRLGSALDCPPTDAQNRASFLEGLAKCEKHINKKYKVSDLCRSIPKRVKTLIKEKGDRIHP